MGSVLVYITKHAKLLIAWSALVAAMTLAVAAILQSDAFNGIAQGFAAVEQTLFQLASYIPRSVIQLQTAVHDAVSDGDTFGALMFWLGGFDVAMSMFSFIAAQFNAICTFVVFVGGAALILHATIWTLRQVQRFAVVLSGGEVNGSQLVD